MKKLKFIILACLLTITLSGCSLFEQNAGFESITYQEYKELIEQKESFVLEMMSSDCPHCQELKPKLQSVLKEYGIKIKTINMAKLSDSDYDEFTKTVGTEATPTIFFYKEGEEKSVATRIVGDVSKTKLIEKLKDNGIIKD